MRKLLLSRAAVAAIAIAGGEPAKAAPPAYNWTGCYIGGNIGGGWSHQTFERQPIHFGWEGGSSNASGIVGGGQIGCDYQSGMWVFGAQGLFDLASIGSTTPFFFGKAFQTRVPWFATATGRVGYLAQPGLLVFARGGAAFVRDEFKFTRIGFAAEPASVTRTGALVGGGFEWMFAPYWSLSVEYNYMGFGTDTVNFPTPERIYQHVHAVLVGLNFRFSTGGR